MALHIIELDNLRTWAYYSKNDVRMASSLMETHPHDYKKINSEQFRKVNKMNKSFRLKIAKLIAS